MLAWTHALTGQHIRISTDSQPSTCLSVKIWPNQFGLVRVQTMQPLRGAPFIGFSLAWKYINTFLFSILFFCLKFGHESGWPSPGFNNYSCSKTSVCGGMSSFITYHWHAYVRNLIKVWPLKQLQHLHHARYQSDKFTSLNKDRCAKQRPWEEVKLEYGTILFHKMASHTPALGFHMSLLSRLCWHTDRFIKTKPRQTVRPGNESLKKRKKGLGLGDSPWGHFISSSINL